MVERSFSVAEANALVPWLEERLRGLLLLRAELRRAYGEMERAGLALDDESLAGVTAEAGDLKGPQARCLALGLAMAEELRGIVAAGVQLKDPAVGLCDFRSERDGRPVLLCWKLGEPAVAHWHELAAGFAGRQPLEPAAPLLAT